jgi:hypothetical protein
MTRMSDKVIGDANRFELAKLVGRVLERSAPIHPAPEDVGRERLATSRRRVQVAKGV